MDIVVDTSKLNRQLDAFRKIIENPEPLLKFIAEEGVVQAVKEHFDKSGPGWAPLSAATLKRRRGGAGKPLLDTGRLRNSIHAGEPAGNTIDVRTEVIYAAVHNFGSRRRRRRDGRGRFSSSIDESIPARPFMTLNDEEVADIQESVEAYLQALTDGA